MLKSKPKHVAIIMDGNGRWAKQQYKPRIFGHRAGAKAVRKVVEYCAQKQIIALTLFAFSTENWARPKEEVSLLMDLFLHTLHSEVASLSKNNVKLKVVGNISAFSDKLQKAIAQVEAKTTENTGLALNIAANYGGRWDITQAAKRCAEAVSKGEMAASDITEQVMSKQLQLAHLPEPDLFIRTGGEWRTSNFLIWQLAYAELYFTKVLWPDFNEEELDRAMVHYAERERRFGKTSEQLK